jgi:ketopantoate hydroxymethyltransferase
MTAVPVDAGGVAALIDAQYRRRGADGSIGVKVNLYRGMEVEGLALALDRPDLRDAPVECVMVGDSYFMTHLGRPSTRLEPGEREWGVTTMLGLVAEVRAALDGCLGARAPYLLGDLPDGAAATAQSAYATAAAMLAAGADAVKLEVADESGVAILGALADREVPVVGHLGYTPQRTGLRRHGDSVESALEFFAAARRLRDAGARALVLEVVSEPVNRALSRWRPGAIPVYSIFSGRAACGGQSLNVWDAVFRPAQPRAAFPPTAAYDAADAGRVYTPDLVARHVGDLLALTLSGAFPPSPRTALDPFVAEAIAAIDPWLPVLPTPGGAA